MDWMHIIYPLVCSSKDMLFSTASTIMVSAWLSLQHSTVILEIHSLQDITRQPIIYHGNSRNIALLSMGHHLPVDSKCHVRTEIALYPGNRGNTVKSHVPQSISYCLLSCVVWFSWLKSLRTQSYRSVLGQLVFIATYAYSPSPSASAIPGMLKQYVH